MKNTLKLIEKSIYYHIKNIIKNAKTAIPNHNPRPFPSPNPKQTLSLPQILHVFPARIIFRRICDCVLSNF